MRLERYIKEGSSDVWKEIQEVLTKDCMEILYFYRDANSRTPHWSPMLRGTRDSIPTYKKYDMKGGRQPRNTDIDIHHMLDVMFLKAFGWRARSESVFATFSDPGDLYGNTYMFFPFDGYRFLYNPKIKDLWTKVPDGFLKDTEPEVVEKHLQSLVDGYTDKNLFTAFARGVELMFGCKSYYLVDTRYEYRLREYIDFMRE